VLDLRCLNNGAHILSTRKKRNIFWYKESKKEEEEKQTKNYLVRT